MTSPRFAVSTKWGRAYQIPGIPDPLPSVTTVIKQQAAPQLEQWKMRKVAEAAVDTQDWRAQDPETAVDMILAAGKGTARRAAVKGTEIHAIIETGAEAPAPYTPYVEAATEVVAQLGATYAKELTLVNTMEGYAGTADLITWTGTPEASTLHILDWKTIGAGKTVGWSSHTLQLAALASCDSYVDADAQLHDLEPVEQISVVGLRPDGTYVWQTTRDRARIGQAYDTFLGLLEAHTFSVKYPFLSFWKESN